MVFAATYNEQTYDVRFVRFTSLCRVVRLARRKYVTKLTRGEAFGYSLGVAKTFVSRLLTSI